MTTGQGSAEELAQDLVLTMQNLEPLLMAMLALMQNADRAAEIQIETLSALMDRIATGLEATTTHLQALGPRLEAQEAGLADLARQVALMDRRLDQQDRGRESLQERVGELLDLLRT